MPRTVRPFFLLALLLSSACGPMQFIEIGLPSAALNTLPVHVRLTSNVDPGSVVVSLDGVDVTAQFTPAPGGVSGNLPIPTPGSHQISVTRSYGVAGLGVPITNGRLFEVPAPAPTLLSVTPAPGAAAVPRTAWLRFRFASGAPATTLVGFGFALECNGRAVARTAHALADGTLVLNPKPELPAGASCRAVWRNAAGAVAENAFTVASNAAGTPATPLYNRLDPVALTPFPDDFYRIDDASMPSGYSLDFPAPPFTEGFQRQVFEALSMQTWGVDGWSRLAPIVMAFSHAIDASALPADEAASIDPMSAISLIDVDPASPAFGERIPFKLVARDDPAFDASIDHSALLFPTIDLRERGHYIVVVTRRAFAAGQPGRPFQPSSFGANVLATAIDGEAPAISQARDRIEPALEVIASLPGVPIPREDVALAFGLSIRTQPEPTDLTFFKEQTLAAPPPELVLPSLANPCPNVNNFCIRTVATRGLEIRGRVKLPNYRDPDLFLFQRDPETWLPIVQETVEVPFMMSLPFEALDGPVPIVMYQHGNPGSPLEAISDSGTGYLDNAGWAVAGIQDTLNRELGQDVSIQVQYILLLAVSSQQLPDFWNQTGADMIGFLRAIQGMGTMDLMHRGPDGLPALGPDGIPEVDPTRILYHGISEGGNNAQRFLPFAPEVIAATPTVGGARLGETIIHQSGASILAQLKTLLPQLRPRDLWIGLSLFQLGFDPQDGHSYLKHLYREPLLPFVGSSDVTPPSSLWSEGIGDTLVPNNATRAMVREIGLPQVRPIARAIPGLEQVDAPVSQNLGPGLTGGYFQYDPATTPYCVTRPQPEGHYCPQSAPEAQAQRRHFLESALDTGSAEIVSPF